MSWKRDNQNAKRKWIGPIERYDLIQEGLIAVVVVFVIVIAINVLFGSPLVHSVSFQTWAQADPEDFASTTLAELTGTSETATYGPPYNNQTGQLQSLGPLSPQAWAGVTIPVDAPADFVLKPLAAFATLNPAVQTAITTWNTASAAEQQAWGAAAISATLTVQGSTVVLSSTADTGPVPIMLSTMLAMAQSGALTSQSIDAASNAYSTDNTKSLLYIEDSNYLGDIATYYGLTGPQWGVMNEIGSWPGQPWLWWYAMWYNVPGWSKIGTDILAVATAVPFIAIFFFLPLIPGLRSLPRWLRIYKLIWRPYYKKYGRTTAQDVAKVKV